MAMLAVEPVSDAASQPVGVGAVRAGLLRTLAGDRPFTIVSNNCWGAHVYQALGITYATPFVGLFVPPQSYLTLLRDFDRLMRSGLEFTPASRSASVNAWREREGLRYPIALLGGEVEIDFQHYRDEAAARETWRRRTARMVADPNRLFFKFDDREGATADDIEAFGALDWPNKVHFTAKAGDPSAVVVPPAPGEDHAPDGVRLATISRRYFNTLRWISALPRWAPLPSLI